MALSGPFRRILVYFGACALFSLAPTGASTHPSPQQLIRGLPLCFERNQGQAEQGVRFLAQRAGYRLLMHADGIAMIFDDSRSLTMRFDHANGPVAVSGEEILPGKTAYLSGGDSSRSVSG